jgi:ATP-dependent RNA helicase DeaD
VEEIRINVFLDKIKQTIGENDLTHYTYLIERLLEEEYTSLDIAAALLKMCVGAENTEKDDLDVGYRSGGSEKGMVRLFLNIGRNQKVEVKDIVGAIAGETGIPGRVIGKIDMYDKYTFIEVPNEYVKDILSVMNNKQIKGNMVIIEPANKK